jgi:hypothetical protein
VLVENEPFSWWKKSASAALGLEESLLKPALLLYLLERLAFHAGMGSEDLSLLQTLSVMVNLLVAKR